MKQVSDRIWLVTLMDYDVEFLDNETCRLESPGNPFAAKVLPMSAVYTVTYVTGIDPLKLARPERFELPTSGFVGRCSIQLSYGRVTV